MIYRDRAEAGRKLAAKLGGFQGRNDVIVLGIPRGGVPVAFQVATSLGVPFDVFVLRKLGVPGHEELAFGAIASGGVCILDKDTIEGLDIPERDIELATALEMKELKRREAAYRGDRPPLNVEGLTVIVVDDGIATGSSMRAAIQALRKLKPKHLVVAAPVVPAATRNRLKREVDEMIYLDMPEPFYGVGQFYGDFSQVSDEEVKELLERASRKSAEPEYTGAGSAR